jgi:hypothetical protein
MQMTDFDLEAINMLRAAGITLAAKPATVLSDDLRGVAEELCDVPADEVAGDAGILLRERIGGLSNLQGYLDCLLVGK